jgi:hypothetical protein
VRYGGQELALIRHLPLDARGHVVDGVAQSVHLAQFVARKSSARIELACTDRVRHAHELTERPHQTPRDQPGSGPQRHPGHSEHHEERERSSVSVPRRARVQRTEQHFTAPHGSPEIGALAGRAVARDRLPGRIFEHEIDLQLARGRAEQCISALGLVPNLCNLRAGECLSAEEHSRPGVGSRRDHPGSEPTANKVTRIVTPTDE